jgi:hypothetical protein
VVKEVVREVVREARPVRAIGYVFASPLVPVQQSVTEYASASFPPGNGILAGAVDLIVGSRKQKLAVAVDVLLVE